jgi:hypothetical protein
MDNSKPTNTEKGEAGEEHLTLRGLLKKVSFWPAKQ